MSSRPTSPVVPTVWLFSAHEPELHGLGALLGPQFRGSVGGYDVRGHAVGIGVAAAAIGATQRLGIAKASAAVFVGTAGVYAEHALELGTVVVGRRLILASSAVAEGRAGYPAPMPVQATCDEPLSVALAEVVAPVAPRVDVATTLAVTTDERLGAALSRAFGCGVEHLEAVAVGLACAAHQVPFAIVLGIANRVGPRGRDEWRENHLRAGEAATARVAAWMSQGGAGLRT